MNKPLCYPGIVVGFIYFPLLQCFLFVSKSLSRLPEPPLNFSQRELLATTTLAPDGMFPFSLKTKNHHQTSPDLQRICLLSAM
jgi:hypothetical protein